MDDHLLQNEMEMSLSTVSETQFVGQQSRWHSTINATNRHQEHLTTNAPDLPGLTTAELVSSAQPSTLVSFLSNPQTSSDAAVEQQLLHTMDCGGLPIPDCSAIDPSSRSIASESAHEAVTFADFQTEPPMASNSNDHSCTGSPAAHPSELLSQLDLILSQGWYNCARDPSLQLHSTPLGKHTWFSARSAGPVASHPRVDLAASPVHISSIGNFVPSPSRKRKTMDGFPASDSQESASHAPARSSRRKSQPTLSQKRDLLVSYSPPTHPTLIASVPPIQLTSGMHMVVEAARMASDQHVAATQDMLMETSTPLSIGAAIRETLPARDMHNAGSLPDDSSSIQADTCSTASTQSASSMTPVAASLTAHTHVAETTSTRLVGRGRRSIPGRSIAGSRYGSVTAFSISHSLHLADDGHMIASETAVMAPAMHNAPPSSRTFQGDTMYEVTAAPPDDSQTSTGKSTPHSSTSAKSTLATSQKANSQTSRTGAREQNCKYTSVSAKRSKSRMKRLTPTKTRSVAQFEASVSMKSTSDNVPFALQLGLSSKSVKAVGLSALPYRRVFVAAGGGKLHYYPGTICAYSSGGYRVVYDDGAYTDMTLKSMRKLICPCRIVVGDIIVKAGGDKRITPKSTRYEVRQSPSMEVLSRSDVISVRPVKSDASPFDLRVESAVLMLTKARLRGRQMTDEDFRAFQECACESDEEETITVTTTRSLKRSGKDSSITKTKQSVKPRPRFYRDFDLEDLDSPTKLKSNLLLGYGLIFTKIDDTDASSDVRDRARLAGARLLDKVADLFDTSNTQQASQHDTIMCFADDDDTAQLSTILLVSSAPSSTVKYLEALALGIPCVSSQWVTDSCDVGEVGDWQLYCLGAGSLPGHTSTISGLQRFVLNQSSYNLAAISSRQQQLQIFAGRKVVFAHGDAPVSQERISMARHLLTALGAVKVLVCSVTSAPSNAELSKYDLIISDHVTLARKQLSNRTVHDWAWMKHCIIAGRILPVVERASVDDSHQLT